MSDAYREAYRLAVEMAGHLFELQNKIRYGMKLTDHPELPKALRDLASGFRHNLELLDCLTPERARDLGEVEAEVAQAESPTANHHEVWAALTRAVGCLNRVFLNVNEAFFEVAKHG
jgi:hypothetical protein